MAPAGDSAEPIAAAELRAEAIDEKRASISAEKRASLTADPKLSHVPAVTPDGELPNVEELATLRRVANTIPAKLFTIAFIELCERFSYYGCTVVCRSIPEYREGTI